MKNLEILTTDINEIDRLSNRLKEDEKRSRLWIPFKIILWGFPIVIGIWASGRLTLTYNILILFILFFIAALTFTASKLKLHSPVSSFSRIVSYLKENLTY